MRFAFLAAAMLCASGCYASHELVSPAGPCALGIPADAPRCIAPNEDPCGPPADVSPECGPDGTWRCPFGAREYAHVPAGSPTECLPFHDPSMGIRHLGGSITRVPTWDGRCLWIGDSVTTTDGTELNNVAFDVDTTLPFGTCPTSAPTPTGRLESIVEVYGSGGPDTLVQITGGWMVGATSVVSYRLFHFDPAGGFGVTEDGTGLGYFDRSTGKIMIPGPASLRWTPDVDLGDAVLPAYHDRSYTYMWGCPPPIHDLVEDCLVARLSEPDFAAEYFTPLGWSATPAGVAAGSFAQGPWLGSVTTSVHGFSHVYAAGFGTTLEQDVATYPYGPWSPTATVARCAIPSSDGHAYCAGPVVHEELRDPSRSDEVPVTYGLGTTDDPGARIAADPDAYWSRLAWVRLP